MQQSPTCLESLTSHIIPASCASVGVGSTMGLPASAGSVVVASASRPTLDLATHATGCPSTF